LQLMLLLLLLLLAPLAAVHALQACLRATWGTSVLAI
jgi:hypothetical protein